jgi:hypothetical protein
MYKIEDFHNILFERKTIPLTTAILAIFDEIQANLVSSVIETPYKPYDKYAVSSWERNSIDRRHRAPEKMHYSHSKRGGGGGGGSGTGGKKDFSTEDWENLRSFKTTKVEESVKGIDKDINEIRISLNKISVNNYEIQKKAIVSKIVQLQNQSPKHASRYEALDCWEDEEEMQPVEVTVPDIADTNLVTVANAIFEIASSNKFFSELYAELYKELSQMFPLFRKIATDFLKKYVEALPKISYVDPNVDYDGFCTYTKENDVKKATSAFIVNLMKKEVISKESVLNIIVQLRDILLEYMNREGNVNEVEELSENWGILVTNSNSALSEEDVWKETVLPSLKEFSKMNPKEVASLSNRVLFKWMNILDSLQKK